MMNQKTPLQRPTLPPRQRRMTLSAVTTGRLETPLRVLVYGQEGIGKSTFGASAPSPIFLCAEEGTSELDVARFPEPLVWQDALDCVDELIEGDHAYRTFVVDTIDWLESLVWKSVCEKADVTSIEDVGGGYGKGFTAALEQWRIFLAALERLVAKRNMNVVLLAHAWIRNFKNPLADDYDRFEMKLNKLAAGAMREWPKAVLFAHYEDFADKDKKTKRVRGITSGMRLLECVHNAAWDAKNRYNLPPTLPLDWQAFESAVRAQKPAEPAQLRAHIKTLLAHTQNEELRARVEKAVEAAGEDAAKLTKISSHLSAEVHLNAPQQESAT